MIRSRTATLLAGLAVTATALSGGAAGVLAQSPAASGGAAAVGVPAVPTGYTELDEALGADKPFNGKRVTIQTQWIGGEGADFDATVADFEAATGIDVVAGEHRLRSTRSCCVPASRARRRPTWRCWRSRPPSSNTATAARPLDVATFMDPAKLNAEFPVDIWPCYSDGAGHLCGIPFKVDVKSTIWYPSRPSRPPATRSHDVGRAQGAVRPRSSPTATAARGASASRTARRPAGSRPTGSRTSCSGPPASTPTTSGSAGDLKFDSPEVRAALDVARRGMVHRGYVYGGSEAITATDRLESWTRCSHRTTTGTASRPAAGCTARRPGIGPDFFPDKRASTDPAYQSKYMLGEDIGMFYFPPIDPAQGNRRLAPATR